MHFFLVFASRAECPFIEKDCSVNRDLPFNVMISAPVHPKNLILAEMSDRERQHRRQVVPFEWCPTTRWGVSSQQAGESARRVEVSKTSCSAVQAVTRIYRRIDERTTKLCVAVQDMMHVFRGGLLVLDRYTWSHWRFTGTLTTFLQLGARGSVRSLRNETVSDR